MKFNYCLAGEAHPSDGVFSKLTDFSSFVGMLVVGLEKEIISLLRKDGGKERAWYECLRG